MKAIMYGGGNIGRGFIGTLFSKSGYEVVFIDVVPSVIEQINRDGQYPVRYVSREGYQDEIITNVRAVSGRDLEAAAAEIATADVMATAVGVNALKFIVDVIAQGLKLRFQNGAKPLNILICENLLDANKVLEGMLKERLTEEECALFDKSVGLVEASIGRMVPVQKPEMQDGNPLRVCVEKYAFLPVDKAAFVGEIPAIVGMVPFAPFDFYIRRKLFIHNMGHACCAYLGAYLGKEYIYEAIDLPEVRLICQNAMTESALALSKTYGVEMSGLLDHLTDVLHRFENSALQDTCARVGNDTKRKLSPNDRLIGAALLCCEKDILPVNIALGAAAAVYQHVKTQELPQSAEAAAAALSEIAQLEADSLLTKTILRLYAALCEGASVRELYKLADALRVEARGAII